MKKKVYACIFTLIITVLISFILSCAGTPEVSAEREEPSETPSETAPEKPTQDLTDTPSPEPSTEPSAKPAEEPALRAAELGEEEEMIFYEEEMAVLEGSEAGAVPPGKSSRSEETGTSYSPSSSESGLKAGFADDNKQYGYFMDFLEKYKDVRHFPMKVQERIILNITDNQGKSLPNADITISSISGRILCKGKTFADGSFLFFPLEHENDNAYRAEIRAMQKTETLSFSRQGKREQIITFPFTRAIPQNVPLDILFILDTTGSMGEEIYRLKTTIELIHMNLTNLSTKPKVRFGLVLYKDLYDDYRTRTIPLTENLDEFRAALAEVEAYGGGDTPEDLQAALQESVANIRWNTGGIRLAFIITDAPPQLDYEDVPPYPETGLLAKEQGIKLYSVGTGGLDLQGEYILRQISQYTSGRYIFLTYGETGESTGGAPGSVSHHTGSNFQTDKLEAIIIRFAKEELSHLTDEPIESENPYFTASRIQTEEREETMEKLFSMAIQELIDYSAFSLSEGTGTAVLPIQPATEDSALNAEYFTEQLTLACGKAEDLTLVERQDLQKIAEEIKLQLSGITDDETAAEFGKVLNADVLISGKLYKKQKQFELFLKLLRVETAEVLSVTRAMIDEKLGL